MDRRGRPPGVAVPARGVGIYVAAGGHVIASLVHLGHGWRITAFFLVAAGGAGPRRRPGRPRWRRPVTARCSPPRWASVLLYVASRTVNLPFGGVHTVHNDRPQDPDLLGTVVVAAELLTLPTGPALLPATAPPGRRTRCCWSASGCGWPGDGPAVTDAGAAGMPTADSAARVRWIRAACGGIGVGAVAVALLMVSGLLPVQTIRIPSDSMTPTIGPGDHLLLDRATRRHRRRRRPGRRPRPARRRSDRQAGGRGRRRRDRLRGRGTRARRPPGRRALHRRLPRRRLLRPGRRPGRLGLPARRQPLRLGRLPRLRPGAGLLGRRAPHRPAVPLPRPALDTDGRAACRTRYPG